MKNRVTVYGAGAAGLMAAQTLAEAGVAVRLCDHRPHAARKFLLAGRGGLNLTHSEDIEKFLGRYGPARSVLEPAIRAFPPTAVQSWSATLGQDTFVGSSGRVFPKAMKASPLLRAWLRRLQDLGVEFQGSSPWTGFSGRPTVLALGGASWPELGSDANWCKTFSDAGVRIHPFSASNARQRVLWSEVFSNRCAGQPLKNISVSVQGRSVRGEAMINRDGIEGNAIYALSHELRKSRELVINLKPDLSSEQILARMEKRRPKDSRSTFLRKAFGLTPAAIALMAECKAVAPNDVRLLTLGAHDVRRAISSAGGVSLTEINPDYSLKQFPNTYVVGEMLDWDAPTGGYLLQACFSTAKFAAQALAAKINAEASLNP